jgi:hypothetical protein
MKPANAVLGALAVANLAMAVAPKWRKKHPDAERAIEFLSLVAMFAVILNPNLLSSAQPAAAKAP